MRSLGYIFLIGGFLFFVIYQVMSKQAALIVISQQRENLPKHESFTPQQVDEVIENVAFDTRRMLSAFAVPAGVMLCGGVLLDRANRRRRAVEANK